jgi:nitroimidazol reductase NimA-like FMN-containing flavoprotein (pyridoxamine 5'-phosphate oxidase superfamily)
MVGRSTLDKEDAVVDDRTRPRRLDRAMPNEVQIEAFLTRAPFGFLAMSVEDQPYVAPKLFWYDKNTRRIYLHSANEGRTRDSILRNSQVCFTAAELGRLLPSEKACQIGVEYASVCVFGHARLVQEDEERLHGLKGLVRKFQPEMREEKLNKSIDQEEVERTAVYAIEIEAWSGKQRSGEA